ncbi:MAG: glutamate--tRNA ligase [Ruminococcus sp.]|nr:glutamate--tRNA ligase [Candidatus Copronaster equi]
MNDNEKLAQLLFPDITKTPEDYEKIYPERGLSEGARVSRFAPSPTGFLHLGGLFASMVSMLTTKATDDGVFFLRIEDTDKKREIEDGVSAIISGLESFGITPDEGVMGFEKESGNYGPYQQSQRKEVYQTIAKSLVINGLAYPCFCSEDELNEIRAQQEKAGTDIQGYFGEWAKCRNLSFEEQKEKIEAGCPFTLRLRSEGQSDRRIKFDDLIKGKIEMPENIQDVVLLKTDGIPTYHFAHTVDDHFMRTTHVIRGDEWISSVPTHIQLFKACGYKVPKYAHISPIMKEDNGGKRKLSKRKDPEASVSFYSESGYPKESVIEYLLTIANSNFEDWRKANKTAPQSSFPFNLKKMSTSGALFDLNKLNDVSKNVISLMTAEEVYDKTAAWAKDYDTELYKLLTDDEEKAKGIFSIDRGTAKPRKDIAKWDEIKDYISYFYDEIYTPDFTLPENISKADAAEIIKAYIDVFDANDDKDTWFSKIKELCEPLGFTPNVKEYKKNPDSFKGHVGDVSTVIRIAITSRKNTPDLHAIIALSGNEKIKARLEKALENWRA